MELGIGEIAHGTRGILHKPYPLKSHLVPFSLYGDDVSTYRNSDVGNITVLGWTSDFTWGNSALLRYFPICVHSEHNAIADITMSDIMSHLVPQLKNMFDAAFLELDGLSFLRLPNEDP